MFLGTWELRLTTTFPGRRSYGAIIIKKTRIHHLNQFATKDIHYTVAVLNKETIVDFGRLGSHKIEIFLTPQLHCCLCETIEKPEC